MCGWPPLAPSLPLLQATLVAELGDLYYFIRLELDPSDLGWASLRPRQFVCGFLKCFTLNVLEEEHNVIFRNHLLAPETQLEEYLDLATYINQIFFRTRTRSFTLFCYMRGGSEEMLADVRWARSRPGAKH